MLLLICFKGVIQRKKGPLVEEFLQDGLILAFSRPMASTLIALFVIISKRTYSKLVKILS